MRSAALDKARRRREITPDADIWYVSVTDFPHGLGSTTRARSMCQALGLAGYKTCLLIPYALGHGKNDQVQSSGHGVDFEYLSRSTRRPATALGVALAKFRGNLTFVRRVTRARSRLACVVVYNASIFDCWGILAAGRFCGIPVVLDLADEWHDPAVPVRSLGIARYLFQRLAKATEEMVYRSVSRVIVVSRHFEQRLAAHSAKTIRCPVAMDPFVFERAVPIRLAGADEFAILYAGSISRTEGVDILIEAFRKVRGDGHRVPRLFVVGNPAHSETIEQYKAAAGELLKDGSVSFLDAVDLGRYASLLRGADLLVIPRPTSVASQAGFPYKLVEYLASGVPVLVTRFGDVEEYFSDGVHCMMCDPDDPESLAACIEFAIARPDHLRTLSGQGQKRVRELFAIDAVAGQLRQLVESVTDRRRP